jgi:hypothetical protein
MDPIYIPKKPEPFMDFARREARNPRTWIDAVLITLASWGIVAMFDEIVRGCQ